MLPVIGAASFPFKGAVPATPNQEAVDVLAYLRSLGWNGKVAGVDRDAIAPSVSTMAGCSHLLSFCSSRICCLEIRR